MKCPRCQHENPTGMKFCGECGMSLARSNQGGPPAVSYGGLERQVGQLGQYGPHQGRLHGYYILIRSSRRSTMRNNSTTRPALATIQIHLNHPWKISATSPPSR
jgi:Double zinc ribbon